MAITRMPVFRLWGMLQHPQQVPCYITHTNEKTHDVIRNNLDRIHVRWRDRRIGPRYVLRSKTR